MPEIPIVSYQVMMNPRGGFIEWMTDDGEFYKLELVPPANLAAIAAILNGPNPVFDPEYKILISSNDNTTEFPSPIATDLSGEFFFT